MATRMSEVFATAQSVVAAQEAELIATRARQPLLVACRTATGSGNIDHTFALDRPYRLVFVRCHFTGAAGRAPMTLGLDSAAGTAFDAVLYTLWRVGVGRDVHFRLSALEAAEPSAWTFQIGDALRVQWSNPAGGNITWGLEVGLAVAS
ncbi:MAG: hypothetical protein HY763_15780 [Planctomycetes bacterium]|nr:hypothetical protein [Planctomycetota bacterium]